MASNHCKIESSACISRLIARSGQFSGDKTKYSALPSAASSNLQGPHKSGESDIFNQTAVSCAYMSCRPAKIQWHLVISPSYFFRRRGAEGQPCRTEILSAALGLRLLTKWSGIQHWGTKNLTRKPLVFNALFENFHALRAGR